MKTLIKQILNISMHLYIIIVFFAIDLLYILTK